VQWPDGIEGKEFVIGVVGNSKIYNTLSTLYGGKAKGDKTFVIKSFNDPNDITNCQVLFIDRTKSNEFTAINDKVKGQGTLTVTDRKGLGMKGSCINFKMDADKLRFELNQHAMEEAKLKASGALLNMAILL
jgi:hypothetical protein